jgi:hypothetical protein
MAREKEFEKSPKENPVASRRLAREWELRKIERLPECGLPDIIVREVALEKLYKEAKKDGDPEEIIRIGSQLINYIEKLLLLLPKDVKEKIGYYLDDVTDSVKDRITGLESPEREEKMKEGEMAKIQAAIDLLEKLKDMMILRENVIKELELMKKTLEGKKERYEWDNSLRE